MKKRREIEAENVTVCRDKKSPYWTAQWRDSRGVRVRRTTKVPVAGGMYRGVRLTAARARKKALDVAWELAHTHEETRSAGKNMTVRALFDKILEGKLGRVSSSTYRNAVTDYRIFCEWFGRRSHEPLSFVTKADMNDWLLARRREVRASTVKKGLLMLRAAFEWAVDSEIIDRNPCRGLKVPPDTRDEKVVKEAFTIEEVRYLAKTLPEEWGSAIRCCMGLYGQRKMDVLRLEWRQFDWEEKVVRITTGKVARVMKLPMTEWFYHWARERYEAAQEKGGEAAVYVHPGLRRNQNASAEFTALVRAHGIGHRGECAGGRRKAWHSKTFHMLRSTCATELHAAGLSEGMAMQLVGHKSKAVHEVYLRPSAEHLRAAAERMPSV